MFSGDNKVFFNIFYVLPLNVSTKQMLYIVTYASFLIKLLTCLPVVDFP